MNRLSKLNNADAQKLDNLMRWDRDCADTVVWLRNNQQRFKMRVFEPPFLSLSVPDKRYANAIEACFGANDQKVRVRIMIFAQGAEQASRSLS